MSSEKTENLGLHTWVPDDYVQMVEFNENFKKIDEKTGELLNNSQEANDKLVQVTEQLAETKTQLEGLEVNVTNVGVYPDGNDYTNQLRTLISTGAIPVFPAGHYKITDELLFKHGQGIRCVGQVILDGTEFVGTNGDCVVKVTNNDADYVALPSLTTDIAKGTREIEFLTSHGLSIGDIICLFDNTNFSWSTSRDYYKKGEFCKVAAVLSTTKILLDNQTFDSYSVVSNGNFGVYKMNMGAFNIQGNLQIIQGKGGSSYGVLLERVKDFSVNNLVAYSMNGSYASVCFEQCYNVDFKGTAIQEGLSGQGLDYGLAILNSQHIIADGYFSASRHGIAHTGKNKIGSIVTRDSKCKGTVKTNDLGTTGVGAFDTHGNTEFVSFEGNVFGGVNIGGSSIKIRGTVHADKDGICVYFRELKSFNHDLSGTKFISNKNPAIVGRGVIDLGGNITAEANKALGGILNFSNIEIIAPISRYGIMLRTRNTDILADQTIDIDLKGSKIYIAIGTDSIGYYISKQTVGAIGFRNLDASNADYISDRLIVADVANSYLPRQKGKASYTTTSIVNSIEITIPFPKKYPTGYIPLVNACLDRKAIGSAIIGKVGSVSDAAFTYQILTMDGTNFNSAVSGNMSWSAE